MTRTTPVVCLHASTASGRQWRRLSASRRTWAWHTPDLYGHGSRPDWPESMPSQLAVEANAVRAGLPFAAGQCFHLVGHGYGGAVALQMALQHPERVLSLTLYEPAAFGMLPHERAREEIRAVATALDAALDRGDDFGAARGLCAYWQRRDLWPELDVAQQLRFVDAMPTVRRHFDALFAASWRRDELGRLRMPVQLMRGTFTRDSTRDVAKVLSAMLPRVRMHWLEGAGHMAPITEAARVHEIILEGLGAMTKVPETGHPFRVPPQ